MYPMSIESFRSFNLFYHLHQNQDPPDAVDEQSRAPVVKDVVRPQHAGVECDCLNPSKRVTFLGDPNPPTHPLRTSFGA